MIDRMYATVLTVGGVVFAGCLLLGEAVDAMGGAGVIGLRALPDETVEQAERLC
ncbi:hypothetical protein QYN14_19050 [Rhodococcus ruber]|uniref:hypothetical protein n=1 Tax=Rhodococcus ruber TaxID=1830 RepID=UPI00265AF799|nr:hypothetical protein [Rhodococcus ruber]WKK10806.1 hypothetical protein QYN14_19050 [Rhodococcus ruber]